MKAIAETRIRPNGWLVSVLSGNMTYKSDLVVYGETLWGCLSIWMTIAKYRVLQ
jgi:hypothetical protein